MSIDPIESEEEYEVVMREIERLFEISEENMTEEEGQRLDLLAKRAMAWEQIHYPF